MIDILLTTYKVGIIEVFDLANYLLSFREGVPKINLGYPGAISVSVSFQYLLP